MHIHISVFTKHLLYSRYTAVSFPHLILFKPITVLWSGNSTIIPMIWVRKLVQRSWVTSARLQHFRDKVEKGAMIVWYWIPARLTTKLPWLSLNRWGFKADTVARLLWQHPSLTCVPHMPAGPAFLHLGATATVPVGAVAQPLLPACSDWDGWGTSTWNNSELRSGGALATGTRSWRSKDTGWCSVWLWIRPLAC